MHVNSTSNSGPGCGHGLASTTDQAIVLPVLRAFPSRLHAVATTPAQGLGALLYSFPQSHQLSPH
jgi:hypothetical protein